MESSPFSEQPIIVEQPTVIGFPENNTEAKTGEERRAYVIWDDCECCECCNDCFKCFEIIISGFFDNTN